jgi:hypothetical protein
MPGRDIDFLPLEYHQQHARRQVQPWRIVVVSAFIVLLMAAALNQYRQRRRAASDLAAINVHYEEAVRQSARLADLKADLQAKRWDAAEFTYLRHPWPRTQLLQAVIASLPKEVTLAQIQLGNEVPPELLAQQRPYSDTKPEGDKQDKSPPSARDLKRLRQQYDNAQTLVRINGWATESGAIHRYLGELAKIELFAKVQLRSLESGDGPQGTVVRFRAVVQVRPGHGQPGGPTVAGNRGKSGAAGGVIR